MAYRHGSKVGVVSEPLWCVGVQVLGDSGKDLMLRERICAVSLITLPPSVEETERGVETISTPWL